MIMHKNMNKRVLLFFFILVVTSSCSNSNWSSCDRDYYNYEFGAYINGQEYHECESSLFNLYPIDGGLRACSRFNTTGIYISGGRRARIGPRRGNVSYGLFIEMYVDSTKYDPSKKYYFSDTTFSQGVLYDKFKNNETVSNSILIGRLESQTEGGYYKSVYTIKEGWLLLGDNECIYSAAPPPVIEESFYSYHCAKFEFIAEGDPGEILTVTNGYCKYIVH